MELKGWVYDDNIVQLCMLKRTVFILINAPWTLFGKYGQMTQKRHHIKTWRICPNNGLNNVIIQCPWDKY